MLNGELTDLVNGVLIEIPVSAADQELMSMRTVLRFVAPAAMVAAFISPSLAADYDPPIIIDDMQEVVPVEVGSGWYLRGDVGYTFSGRTENRSGDFLGISAREENSQFFGGAGFGYHFTDYFRTDLTAAFLRSEEFDVTVTDPSVLGLRGSGSIDTKMGYAMLTGYVDLGTVMGFTPYLGAGAGVVYTRPKISGTIVDVDGSTFGGSYKEHDFSFAYTLNAGLAYKLTQNLSLDVGYQYLNSPDAEYFSVDSPSLYDKGFDMHQVKVGLRYDLW
jgi:opacity protein-like surface antigen